MKKPNDEVKRAIINKLSRIVPGAIIEVDADCVYVTGRHPDGGIVTHRWWYRMSADEVPIFEAHCDALAERQAGRRPN